MSGRLVTASPRWRGSAGKGRDDGSGQNEARCVGWGECGERGHLKARSLLGSSENW